MSRPRTRSTTAASREQPSASRSVARPAKKPPAPRPVPSPPSSPSDSSPTENVNQDIAVAVPASARFLQVPDLRQALYELLDLPSLARFARVSKGRMEELAHVLYGEVDFKYMRTKMSRKTTVKRIHSDAVRRVTLGRNWETPALKKEAKTIKWVALGHPKAMRQSEKELLAALKLIRTTCPNVEHVGMNEGTVKLTLGPDIDNVDGQYEGPDTYELIHAPFGAEPGVILPPRRRAFCSPLNGLTGYTRTVTSIDLLIPFGTKFDVNSMSHLPADLGSIRHAGSQDTMKDFLDLPQAILSARGDTLRSLHTIKLESMTFATAEDFLSFAKAFSGAPLRNLCFTPSRHDSLAHNLNEMDLHRVFCALSNHLPTVKRLQLDIAWPLAYPNGCAPREWDMKMADKLELDHLELRVRRGMPCSGTDVLKFAYQCAAIMAPGHTTMVSWKHEDYVFFPRGWAYGETCKEAISFFRKLISDMGFLLDLRHVSLADIGIFSVPDIPMVRFSSSGDPLPILPTMLDRLLSDSASLDFLAREPELLQTLRNLHDEGPSADRVVLQNLLCELKVLIDRLSCEGSLLYDIRLLERRAKRPPWEQDILNECFEYLRLAESVCYHVNK